MSKITQFFLMTMLGAVVTGGLMAVEMRHQAVENFQAGVKRGKSLQLLQQRPAIENARKELINKKQQLGVCKSQVTELKRMYYDRDGSVPKLCPKPNSKFRGALYEPT